MKKYIKATQARINRLNWKIKYFLIFSAGIFVAFSALTVLAFSDWYFNHRTSQPTASRIETQPSQNQYENVNTIPVTQPESVQTKPTQTNQAQKTKDTISEADQLRIEELKRQEAQLKEYNKQMEEGFDNLENTISSYKVAPPPEPKPLTVPKVDTKIETPKLPQPHTKQVCWDDSVFGKQCKTTVEFY